ncbi:MAG TPA: NFACT RNA binding domain-containing protein [Candidatus Limnocylindrales bacterium]|nr:NFACT RNA binding domain-containing protein [Candidatus Limnocylindrales bacterium]
MKALPEALRGRRVTGVVPLGPRSLALALGPSPRLYLWVHLDRKEAALALASELPIAADPRGSRFGGLETPVRGLAVADAVREADGALRLTLAPGSPESGEPATAELVMEASGRRANLILRSRPEGTVLWALHRDETEPPASPPPPGFHPARVWVAEGAEERALLRERIAGSFREEFEREVRHRLDAAERVLARRIEALEGDRVRSRERILDRRKAEVLLAHLNEVPRGASRVGLPDPYADSPGSRIEIELDPSLSPHENAAKLFRGAKRGERGGERIESRLLAASRLHARLADLRRYVTERPPKEALALLETFSRDAGIPITSARGDQREIRLGRQTTAAPRAGRPVHRPSGARHPIGPRTFATSDGWEVWVGRNNTQNDQITHRLSNPHDYWFHVVGVPGSHVILRRPSRNAIPKRRTLEEAASIAAYFSKARKLTRVPVIYTERKFVSKPRRGKPGLALCTREREILVRPKLPEGGSGTNGEREVSS